MSTPTATPRTTAALEWVRPAGNDSGPPNEQYVCADVARTLETELAEAKAERETVAEASLRSLEAYIDKLKQFAERAEKAEAALAEWSVLNLWGGTPEIIHEFIKGQQNRIHHCQDLEAECLEQARLLGMSGEREADLLGKIDRLNRVIERASVQFFHDGSDGETAAKMLTVLNEAK